MGELLLLAAVLAAAGSAWLAARSSKRAHRIVEAAEAATPPEAMVERIDQVLDSAKQRLENEVMRLLVEQADAEQGRHEPGLADAVTPRLDLMETRINDLEAVAARLRRRLEQDDLDGGI